MQGSQSKEFIQIVGMIGIEVMHATVGVKQQWIVLIQWFIAVVLMFADGCCFLNVVCSLWFYHKRTAQHGNCHDDKHDSGNDFTANKHGQRHPDDTK